MSWQQSINDASVSVSRCTWAKGVTKFNNPATSSWKNMQERNEYIMRELKEAIKDLNKALKELNDELIIDET